MQETTLTRRSFVKAATIASAALAVGSTLSGCLQQKDPDETPGGGGERAFYNSVCHGCIQGCPCKVYVEDGVVVKIEGHPDAPTSRGSLCIKGLNQIHTCYSPRRILYPMKRTGPKGAANATFERISWDEAAELAGTMIAETIEKYGTYSFFCSSGGGGMYGGGGPVQTLYTSFMGTNGFEPGAAQCLLPRETVSSFMWGGSSQSIADCGVLEILKGLAPAEEAAGITNDTKCLIIWGTQPSVSQTSQSGRAMAELRARGCKTIVIDPNFSPDAAKSTIHLPVRPGSDAALILSWYRIILDETLYDEEFTKYFTNLPCLINPDTKLPWLAIEVFDDYVSTTPDDTPVYVCIDEDTGEVTPLPYGLPTDIAQIVNPQVLATAEVNGKQSRSAGQVYRDEAEPWTLERAEEFCWVPADRIRAAIDLYTNPPGGVAGISHGVATDMQEISSQVPMGLMGLDMIMGYINKPGVTLTARGAGMGAVPVGDGITARPTAYSGISGMFSGAFGCGWEMGASKEANEARVNSVAEVFDPTVEGASPFFTKQNQYLYGQLLLDRLGMKNHRGIYEWLMSHIPSVREAIETGEPYHPRVWYEFSGNKLAMLGSAGAWYNALMNDGVDYIICQYANMTSFHIEFADVIFPTEEWLEATGEGKDQLYYSFPSPGIIHLGETAPFAVPVGKAYKVAIDKLNEKLDSVVFSGTGQTMSELGLNFPFGTGLGVGMMGINNNEEEVWASQIATFGAKLGLAEDATKEDFMEALKNNHDAYLVTSDPKDYWVYDQHLYLATDGLPRGFSTTSRKCEVYCTMMLELGRTGKPFTYPREIGPIDPRVGTYDGDYSPICNVPMQKEAPQVANSDGYIMPFDPDFPLAMTSGRVYYFHHGTMRHAPYARELYPVPFVRINPKTAAEYGIEDGDWVEISSRRTQGTDYDPKGTPGTELSYSKTKEQNTKTAEPIRTKAYVAEVIAPNVLWMERFWNPECFDSAQSNKTGGWAECSVNVLTNAVDTNFNEVFGSYTNRAFAVNIKKSEKPAGVWVEPKEFEPFMPTNRNEYVPEVGVLIENKEMLTPIVEFPEGSSTPVPAPTEGGR
jgi:anaerobic selenocysteine-containing dehydrogenase